MHASTTRLNGTNPQRPRPTLTKRGRRLRHSLVDGWLAQPGGGEGHHPGFHRARQRARLAWLYGRGRRWVSFARRH